MESIFIKLLNMSIAAGWLILAVIILRVLLGRAPKWIRCVLWGIVAVRLICPISFECTLSLVPDVGIVNPDIVGYSPTPAVHGGVPPMDQVVTPVIAGTSAAAPGTSANPLHGWMYIAEIVWMVGLISLLGHALFSYFRLRRSVSGAILLRDNIWLADMVQSPFILGIFRPRIYLSSSTGEGQMAYILAHEQAHLMRRDHWWKLIGYVLLAVYWFHPLSWVAYVLLCRDIESACDEKVIREFDEHERRQYSKALVSCSIQRRMVMACPLSFGEVGVKQRVKAVLNYRKPSFWIVSIAILACLITAVCFLTTPPETSQTSGESYGENYGETAQAAVPTDVGEEPQEEMSQEEMPGSMVVNPVLDLEEVGSIVIVNGNDGSEMTFSRADSDDCFGDLLQLYGQLDFAADTETNTRSGYSYAMKMLDADGGLLHSIIPYKDGFVMDDLFYRYDGPEGLDQPSVELMNRMDILFYPPTEEYIISRVLTGTAFGWSNTVDFKSDADILIKMAVDSTGEYEVYGIISKELGKYGLVLNDIIDGENNYNYVYEPWVYTGAPQDTPKLEWSEDGKTLLFSYISSVDGDRNVWRQCIVDCGYATGHMELVETQMEQ